MNCVICDKPFEGAICDECAESFVKEYEEKHLSNDSRFLTFQQKRIYESAVNTLVKLQPMSFNQMRDVADKMENELKLIWKVRFFYPLMSS